MTSAEVLKGSAVPSDEDGMKATIPTKAFMANETEDPTEYDKLEVSCHFTVSAGKIAPSQK